MFTGLVQECGTVRSVQQRPQGLELRIEGPTVAPLLAIGDSVAVDGVCLTAEQVASPTFVVTAAAETLAVTSLSRTSPGRRVHLEPAMRLGDRLGGHLVQGHVDGVGRVTRRELVDGSPLVEIEVPAHLARYIIPKGSIALDGVSLTVNGLTDDRLDVLLIPHTLEMTHLGHKKIGDRINVEVDLLAKYVERLLAARLGGEPAEVGLTLEKLSEHGYVGPGRTS